MSSTQAALNQALTLMDQATRLGSLAHTMPKPTYIPPPPKTKSFSASKSKPYAPSAKPAPLESDITFRNIAEDYAAQRDLVFLPLGRSHEVTGKPLFRVSKAGKGGVVVYVGGEAVFAQTEDGWRAVSLDDMVKRASS